MKHSQTIGIIASILLIGTCFLPWIEVPNQKIVIDGMSGYIRNGLTFGKPIKLYTFFVTFSVIFFTLKYIWAKVFNIIFCMINFGLTIAKFALLFSCRPECPIIKPGLYLLVFFSCVMLLMSFLPKIKIEN